MVYDTPLPSTHKLKTLAEWGGPFPIQNRHLVLIAERFGFDDRVIQFLHLFPNDTIFESRRAFVERCEALKDLLHAEEVDNATVGQQYMHI